MCKVCITRLRFCKKLSSLISNQIFCLVKKEENMKDIQWMPVQHLSVACMDLRSQQWKVWGQLTLPCILFRLNSWHFFYLKQCIWYFLCALSFFSHLDKWFRSVYIPVMDLNVGFVLPVWLCQWLGYCVRIVPLI